MTITLLDTITGETLTLDAGDQDPHWWAEGNGSCDCNRALTMGIPWDDAACGRERFLITDCSDPAYSLAELNQGYPPPLLIAAGISPTP